MSVSKLSYYLKVSLICLTVIACAFVSSLSTYQGLQAVLDKSFSLALAICSGLILVMLPFAMFKLLDNARYPIVRFAYFIIIPLGIFVLSTVWSIVGLAKDEIFMNLVQETNTNFVNNYYPSEITGKLEKANLLIGNVEAFAEQAEMNAKTGVYSGLPGVGDISRTVGVLHGKAAISKIQLQQLESRVSDELDRITELVSRMHNLNHWDDRNEYMDVIREVNRNVKSIEDVGLDVMLNDVITNVESARDNLITIQKEKLKRATSKGVIDSEIRSLQAYADELQRLNENLVVSLPLVNVRAMDTPIVLLAFKNMLKIINWWALCLGLDFAPFPLIYLLGTLRDPFEFD